jgi:carbamoyl-phosphate synthase small subunit
MNFEEILYGVAYYDEYMPYDRIETDFKMIRDAGMNVIRIASTEVSDPEKLKAMLASSPRIEEVNYIEKVSTPKSYVHDHGVWNAETQSYNATPKRLGKKILAVDLGIKHNI